MILYPRWWLVTFGTYIFVGAGISAIDGAGFSATIGSSTNGWWSLSVEDGFGFLLQLEIEWPIVWKKEQKEGNLSYSTPMKYANHSLSVKSTSTRVFCFGERAAFERSKFYD